MATIATQPQVGYRPGPRWMALFLVAAAGIGAGTVALVQTMTSEGVTAGRTAAVSSVDGATQTRALNQTEASIPYGERLSGLAGDSQAVAAITKALADANRDNAAATRENVAAQRELQNEQLKLAGIADGRR